MIQAYKLNNKNYDANADTILLPESATVHAELNGVWELEIEHPIDEEGRWKAIAENVVVRVPSFNGTQLFRIYSAEKEDDGVTAKALPIFLDARNDCFLKDVRPTNKNGQSALADMCAPNKKYRGRSNITKTNTAYFEYVNLIEAINGDIEQSFINRWGGEILFDNFEIIINDRVGGDYGVEVVYGKNIPRNGMKESVDMSEVVTRIYPKAYNGRKMSGTGYVDSSKINNYPVVHQRTQTFSDVKMAADCSDGEDTSGIIVCEDQQGLDMALRSKCRELFNNGIDVPKVHISVDMVLLQDVDLYKDLKVLETVSLGDTIHCKHSKLGIVTDARVISLEYDCLRKKVEKVKLGDFENRYIDKVQSAVDRIETAITPSGGVIAERVEGILNGMNTQLQIQSTSAQKVKQRAIKFEELDEKDPMYGCMALGTQGFQIASKKTADGRDWEWRTAGTPKGFVADNIVTGLLSDRTGRNYWNLDTGDFRLASDAFLVDGKPLDEILNKDSGLNIFIPLKTVVYCTGPSGNIPKPPNMPNVMFKVFANIGSKSITASDAQVKAIYDSSKVKVDFKKIANAKYQCTIGELNFGDSDVITIRFSLDYDGAHTETSVIVKRDMCLHSDGTVISPLTTVTPQYLETNSDGLITNSRQLKFDSVVRIGTLSEPYQFGLTHVINGRNKETGEIEKLTTANTDTDSYTWNFFNIADKMSKYDKLIVETTYKEIDTGVSTATTVEIPIYRPIKKKELTQKEVFDALTNKGATQGIYMNSGNLYVNGSYIATGVLSDKTEKNYWNLDTGDFRLSSSNFLIDNKPLGEFFENEEKKKKNLNIWIAQKVIAVGTDSTGAIIGKFPKIYVTAKLMINDRQLHPKSDDYKVSFIKGQNSYVSCREDSGFAYVDWHDMRANANEDSVTIRLEYKDMVAEETVTIKKVACEQTGAETMVYSIGVATLYDEVVFDENGALVHPTGARIDMRPEKSVIEGNEKYVFLYNGEVETTFTAHKKNGGTLALGTTKTTNGDFGFTIPTDLVPKLFKYDKIVAKCRFSSTGATAISEIPIYRKYSKYSHEDIFNALTNNGEIKGIYKQGNQLYISFDYARGGTMRLGGVASGMGRLALSDENNQEFSTIDSSGYIIKDLKTGDSTRIIPSGIVRRSSGVDRPYHYFTKIGKIVHQKADFKGGGYEETYCDGVLEIGVRDLPKGFKLTLENIYMQIVSIQSGIVLGDDYANNIQALANNAINIKSVTLDIAVYKIAYTCTCTYFLPKRNNFKDRFVSPKSITIQYMIIG